MWCLDYVVHYYTSGYEYNHSCTPGITKHTVEPTKWIGPTKEGTNPE